MPELLVVAIVIAGGGQSQSTDTLFVIAKVTVSTSAAWSLVTSHALGVDVVLDSSRYLHTNASVGLDCDAFGRLSGTASFLDRVANFVKNQALGATERMQARVEVDRAHAFSVVLSHTS